MLLLKITVGIFGVVCVLGVENSARADSVTVFHEAVTGSEPYEIVQARFRINETQPALGRAWVEITRRKQFTNGEDRFEESTTSRNIPGLSFDPASGEVRYLQSNGKNKVCARLQENQFLFIHWKKVKETGSCILSGSVSTATIDDGFQARTRQFANVMMEVVSDGRMAEAEQIDQFPASISAKGLMKDPGRR